MEGEGLVPTNSGYKYTDEDGIEMVEYHVDSSYRFQDQMNTETEFGGKLSVRLEQHERPLIIFGHDECIFKQFHVTKKAWTGPNGETVLIPKDDGQGVMISGFQSREFGYGLDLTGEQLRQVSEFRKEKKYIDEAAATKYRGKGANKDILNVNPFVLEFEYGAANEGYWNYEHMVLQLDDCVDVVKFLYPQYDFLFLFDHSCGHDKQREDGLNVENMSKSYGGKQSVLRPTLIKEASGYLGPFPRSLDPGDTQFMDFQPNDDGPFWMSREEKERKRNDLVIPNKTVNRQLTKAELTLKLQEHGVTATGNITNIKKLCGEKGILLVESNIPKIQPGWEGKQKGMLQVLWERGWIDVEHLRNYTVDGKKDVAGVVRHDMSLKYLLGNCKDFEEEESLLQAMGKKLGVTVDRTPKCHCELAGEGIEYSWGCAKNAYRQKPLSDKRRKDKFRDTVRKCLSRDVLTTERVRKFSRRAREYICAYRAHHQVTSSDESRDTSDSNVATPVNIEKLVKEFKTHRCALDFDKGFVVASIVKKEE